GHVVALLEGGAGGIGVRHAGPAAQQQAAAAADGGTDSGIAGSGADERTGRCTEDGADRGAADPAFVGSLLRRAIADPRRGVLLAGGVILLELLEALA